MKTKDNKELIKTKDFLKQRILDFLVYADRAYFEEDNDEMYKYYLNRAKECVDGIGKINIQLKK